MATNCASDPGTFDVPMTGFYGTPRRTCQAFWSVFLATPSKDFPSGGWPDFFTVANGTNFADCGNFDDQRDQRSLDESRGSDAEKRAILRGQ